MEEDGGGGGGSVISMNEVDAGRDRATGGGRAEEEREDQGVEVVRGLLVKVRLWVMRGKWCCCCLD